MKTKSLDQAFNEGMRLAFGRVLLKARSWNRKGGYVAMQDPDMRKAAMTLFAAGAQWSLDKAKQAHEEIYGKKK